MTTLQPGDNAPDFTGILQAMDELPVTIRLLDPPLHEFVPHTQAEAAELGKEIGVSGEVVWRRSEALREMNPMLGHRGCRLGVTYPEIYEMQVRAILAAAKDLVDQGHKPQPEIMLPLIGTVEEYVRLHELVMRIAKETLGDAAEQVPFLVGTMIEIPRAALLADRIAQHAQFFSFGTNDLTQLVFGYSRDDAGTFLPDYVKLGILSQDPFEGLDQEGVGSLVRMATEKGRSAKADLKVGICGEHGGDPRSIQFFHDVGLNYVSCSPFRVPIARLAAAQATIRRA
jgi:pyruvate,orthophosphate dikinase